MAVFNYKDHDDDWRRQQVFRRPEKEREGQCDFCKLQGPVGWVCLNPIDEEYACYECRGLTELECGKHLVNTVVASCGGLHMPVTTCSVCDGESNGKTTNHTHTGKEEGRS